MGVIDKYQCECFNDELKEDGKGNTFDIEQLEEEMEEMEDAALGYKKEKAKKIILRFFDFFINVLFMPITIIFDLILLINKKTNK